MPEDRIFVFEMKDLMALVPHSRAKVIDSSNRFGVRACRGRPKEMVSIP